MKKFISSILLTSCFWGITGITCFPKLTPAAAQVPPTGELLYNFYGRSIPLRVRQDTVAVSFKPAGSTRSLGTAVEASYLRLQRDLQGGTRSLSGNNLEVKPLGLRYALVNLPAGTSSSPAAVTQRVEKLPYVAGTHPVLSRSDRDETIVLPNEIVVAFEPEVADEEAVQAILNRYNLEIIKPLRFANNRYLVRSQTESGIAILAIANRLNSVPGITSATPNFVQSVTYSNPGRGFGDASFSDTPRATESLKQMLNELEEEPTPTPFQTELLPLQWHLNSIPLRGKLLPRTDIRAIEAWQQSNQGSGVVVAVIDSLIQWDHPDLNSNVYKVENVPNQLPGEIHGWDFAQDDPDTRISEEELASLLPDFQNTFSLSDAKLLEQYADLASFIPFMVPDLPESEIAPFLRNLIRNKIAGEFHGTWSAGVIAARPQGEGGVVGVAPQAKILPIRVFGLGGETSPGVISQAIRYAAARGVDAINLSLGGLLPTPEEVEAIFEVLDANPNLVIIASAGNESLDGVAFPAAIPGVISVGATNLSGKRATYSSYGGRLDVVAPGGDTSDSKRGGILTTGGTGVDGFWQGIGVPDFAWGYALDSKGQYVQVEGTSFAAPTVSGVVALMKGENPKLTRDRIIAILKETSNYQGLNLSKADTRTYRLQRALGFGSAPNFPFLRPSGVFPLPEPIPASQYFYGSGLVNAEAAVNEVKQSLQN